MTKMAARAAQGISDEKSIVRVMYSVEYSVLVKDVTRYMGFWFHSLFTQQTADRTAMK